MSTPPFTLRLREPRGYHSKRRRQREKSRRGRRGNRAVRGWLDEVSRLIYRKMGKAMDEAIIDAMCWGSGAVRVLPDGAVEHVPLQYDESLPVVP